MSSEARVDNVDHETESGQDHHVVPPLLMTGAGPSHLMSGVSNLMGAALQGLYLDHMLYNILFHIFLFYI